MRLRGSQLIVLHNHYDDKRAYRNSFLHGTKSYGSSGAIQCSSQQPLSATTQPATTMRAALLVAIGTTHAVVMTTRRRIGASAAAGIAGLAPPAHAADADLPTLRRGLLDLEDLVQNWKERTTNCNYAEVNRDLLGSQNKAALLKQASENAAVAKGSAVKTLCKRDPEAVRRILGLDGKLNAKSAPLLAPGAARQERLNAEDQNAALADADRMIRKGLEFTSDLDGYVEANEKWLRAVSAIDSATYSSRSQDLGAVISTTAGGAEVLDSALSSVVEARDALRVVVKLRSM
uniref:Uncharacterized protein n=2 Tax=Pelagomonas calceolata TaxID=35677 RepID=A0A7S3ZZ94_9STRA